MAVAAAGHRESARAAGAALASGGNAVDAACAAAFAGAVCEPILTGLGAGGFLLIDPPNGSSVLLDAFVAVPGLGPGGGRLDPAALDSFVVPFGDAQQEFHIGPASVAVPGFLSGLLTAWRAHGTLALADLVAPAVALARHGVVVTPEAAFLHAIVADMLVASPGAGLIYAPGGTVARVGERVFHYDLADVLVEIADTGRDVMLDGGVGRAIVDDITPRGGLVTASDLQSYAVIEREPLRVRFRAFEIATNPPPSSGGILIAAALHALAGTPLLDAAARYVGVASAGRFANGLRDSTFAANLGEPGFAERFIARLATADGARGSAPPGGRLGSTTHVSVIDAFGGAVAMTSSNGSGSGVVVPGTGVLLNNMLGEEDLNPGGFGHLVPGTRMTSMVAPTIVRSGGKPVLALGSAGSNRLRSAILHTLVAALDGGLDLRAAVAEARVHPEGETLHAEPGIHEHTLSALREDGHSIREWASQSLFFGGVAAAGRSASGLSAAGDPRRGGAAVSVTRAGEVIDR